MDASEDTVHQLKVVLQGTRPPVWRRFLIPSRATLEDLHVVLQRIMGWHNYHLHQFERDGVLYGTSDRGHGVRRVSETRTKLHQVLRQPKEQMMYEYDFGDSWVHTVTLEKILPFEPDRDYPVITAGRRACPPEDVGGVFGYAVMLEALADPGHEDHEHFMEWVGEEYDPEAFDMRWLNARMHGRR